MTNTEISERFRGKASGIAIIRDTYESSPIVKSLAAAYHKDVGELCSIIEQFDDRPSEVQALNQLARFYESLMCPCDCSQEDPSITVSQEEDGRWIATCDKCESRFPVAPKQEKK